MYNYMIYNYRISYKQIMINNETIETMQQLREEIK